MFSVCCLCSVRKRPRSRSYAESLSRECKANASSRVFRTVARIVMELMGTPLNRAFKLFFSRNRSLVSISFGKPVKCNANHFNSVCPLPVTVGNTYQCTDVHRTQSFWPEYHIGNCPAKFSSIPPKCVRRWSSASPRYLLGSHRLSYHRNCSVLRRCGHKTWKYIFQVAFEADKKRIHGE